MSTRGASNKYPQHMFLWRNKKNIMWIPPLICSYVTSGPLLSFHTFCSISDSADSEGPDQTARMRRLICAFVVRIYLKLNAVMQAFL